MHYDNGVPQLQFSKYHGFISNEIIDKYYGKYGRTFKSLLDAEAFAKQNPGSIVTKLQDYFPGQVERRGSMGCPRDGCKPHIVGYLVTLPASWRNY